MLRLNLYIHSYATINPLPSPGEAVEKLLCKEPDYAGIIPPMQLRRMSKAVRIGIGAAKECLAKGGIEVPDAIITGTGYGCLQDTESFLKKMIEQEEQMLTPTSFIQSTHNTVAGQIALVTGCTGYNNTITQSGQSFEGAAIAAQLYLNENPGHKVLLGGVEELTETSFKLLQRAGIYSQEKIVPDTLFAESRKGTLAGEGVAFFLVSDSPEGATYRITGLEVFNNCSHADLSKLIMDKYDGFDLLISGRNGDKQYDDFYNAVESINPNSAISYFKNEYGDFPTAISLGLAKAVKHSSKRTLIVNNWYNSFVCWVVENIPA